MLLLTGEVYFDTLEENSDALMWDLNTANIVRPALNFGNDLLFSGTVQVDQTITTIHKGEYYKAIIKMPTIEQEAYELIHSSLNVGNIFLVQNASKVIGKFKLSEAIFE